MLARIHSASLARAVLVALAVPAVAACAHRPAACSRACDEGFACVAGECLRAGTVLDVEGLDRLGLYRARRLVVAPLDVVRLAPGEGGCAPDSVTTPPVATLGRERDAAAILLLRFAVDLPPEARVIAAQIVLDRAPTVDPDPAPVLLRAARVVEPWDGRSVSWGRAPRIADVRSPVTTVDDARTEVRVDVRALVRRWRLHAADDQGIALVADRASPSGITFALADGGGTKSNGLPALALRTLRDTPPAFHGRAGAVEGLADARGPSGPRLELYLTP